MSVVRFYRAYVLEIESAKHNYFKKQISSADPLTKYSMTTPQPSKSEDIKTTLNRIRKNYAQNPLYVWLFSASCTSPNKHIDFSTCADSQGRSTLSWHSGLVEYSGMRYTHSLRRVSPLTVHSNVDMELR